MSISATPVDNPPAMASRVISEVLGETSHTDPTFLSSAQKHDVLVGLDRCLDRLDARRSGAWPAVETEVRRAAESGRLSWAQAAVLMHALVALTPPPEAPSLVLT